MNAVNSLTNRVFDLLLSPLDAVGAWLSLTLVSGVFGILALVVFKRISWQAGIKSTKDKIKGHMIEIRIYQDDLALVSRAIGKVLYRNLQYVVLNFGPFLPLMVPFGMVAAQLVVRYGFEPVAVQTVEDDRLAGQGTTFEIEFIPEMKSAAGDLVVDLPEGVVAVSPLVRVPRQGRAFIEVVAIQPGIHEISFTSGSHTEIKLLHAGIEGLEREMQPERGRGFLSALLWPAEPAFAGDSPFALIRTVYPERPLGWLPGSGPIAVLLAFVLLSMAFGFAALKPLGVEI
ncbi:MAG TPA: hypothetical protein EYQ25_05985 [Planctomycetes bacterium]|nr:hypothetical protein [Planctomycetota bacterium]HIL36690.1 hypothetical protein [Planctomycetota bacterium]